MRNKTIIIIVFFSLFACKSIVVAQQNTTKSNGLVFIQVRDNWAKKNDTLFLRHYPNTLHNTPDRDGYIELQSIMGEDSLYRFKFAVNKASGSFFVSRKIPPDSIPPDNPSVRFYVLSNLLMPDAGDSVTINITEYVKYYRQFKSGFTGRGSEKYTINEALKTIGDDIKTTFIFDKDYTYVENNSSLLQTKAKLKYVDGHSSNLTALQAEIIKANMIYGNLDILGAVDFCVRRLNQMGKDSSHKYLSKFQSEYNRHFGGIPDYGFSREALLKSKFYISYVLQKISKCDFVVNQIENKTLYSYLKHHFDGEVRDQLLTVFFEDPDLTSGAADKKDIYDAVKVVKSPYCLERLNQMIYNGSASDKAYNFSLPDQYGKTIRMSDFNSKIVLMDFWYTGCGNCIEYYKQELSLVEEKFRENHNIVFLSVCIDRDKKTWLKSVADGKYTSPVGINLSAPTGLENGIIDFYKITGYPTVLLINNGQIINSDQSILREKKSLIAEIQKALK